MENSELQEQLFSSLNEQGYLFQEACKYELDNNITGWSVRAYEYPVSIQKQDTKVDIILSSNRNPERFALVECKRTNPSYASWLFGVPDLNITYSPHCSVLWLGCNSVSSNSPMHPTISLSSLEVDVPTYIAQSWLEIKKGKSKNNSSVTLQERTSTPQNIENAFAQVLKGVSGFAQEQCDQRVKGNVSFSIQLIPVVVTTASLYMAYYKPCDISISTGKIDKDKVLFSTKGPRPEELKWILVYYGAGESVAPSAIPSNFIGTDPKYLLVNKLRSIFIVNSNYLVEFFKKLGSY